MKLSYDDVTKTFQDLIDGKISREDADRWAYEIIQAYDSDNLAFVPEKYEERLWGVIQYLYGIDLKTSSDEYMHSISQIKQYYYSQWKI